MYGRQTDAKSYSLETHQQRGFTAIKKFPRLEFLFQIRDDKKNLHKTIANSEIVDYF
jgi:hypothetical protein